MIKIIFILIFLLPVNLFSLEVCCRFEEVYKDGITQQGFFLLKNDKIRYEYLDKNLFTIIIKNKKHFLIPNYQRDSFSLLDENTELINNLANMLIDFENIKKYYNQGDYTYIIEKSSNDFIKRVAIKSKDLTVSINFLDCEFKNINDKYFIILA